MARRALTTLLLVPMLSACAPDFEPASALNTLRVLAVQKDKPYAKPGDTVTLRMLVADGSTEAPRPIQILWLGGFCENPLADLYAGCFANFQNGTMGAPGPLGLPSSVVVGEGPEFQVTLSRDIISRRPRPVNPKQPPYGVSYVFFLACAGTVGPNPAATGPNPTENFPLACFAADKSRVGPEGFVVGYTELFAYDQLTNLNPIVTGFEVDGQSVAPECTGAACIVGELVAPPVDGGLPGADGGADASSEASVPGGAGGAGGAPGGSQAPVDPCKTDSPACLDVCPKGRSESDCEHTVKLLVDPKSDEQDGVAVAIEGRAVYEQLWINHYTEQGKIAKDVKLLGDTTLGYHEEHETKLVAPRTPGPFHLWAVAHDNRGGTEWVRVLMSARDSQ